MSRSGSLEQLTARQAAARLGVKVETVYAYVSRGQLERRMGEDGRTSLFDAGAVEKLARRRRGSGPKTGGLSVVLGTGLTLIEEGRVSYRGRDVGKLAPRVPFEAVAEWLWLGEHAPDEPQEWRPWRAGEESIAAARNAQGAVPEGTASADLLRAIASAVAPTDPLRFDLSPPAVVACGRRLIATLVDGLPRRGRSRVGPLALEDGPARPDAIACRLWPRLTRQSASPEALVALNATLVLAADHGLAASTLAARVAASVRADPCSVVATGLGALSGPLHGAASASVHRLMAEVGEPERAVAVLGDFLRRERLIPGYGHLIYDDWDPRAVVLLELMRRAGLPAERMDVVERLLELLEERAPVRPNVDFSLGAFTWAAGMDERAGETIFGVARSAGWIAHALEEYQEPPLRFRPRAHYIGPAPVDEG
jgi:citrate synthase